MHRGRHQQSRRLLFHFCLSFRSAPEGLSILLPDVNASDWAYTGYGRTIRIGLMQIKTLPESLGKRIVEERNKKGRFRSFQDFIDRVKPEPAHARTLVLAGCCDSLAGDLTRPALLWRLYAGPHTRSALPLPEDYAPHTKLDHERDTLGLLASRHPLELYAAELQRLPHVPGSALIHHVGRTVTMVGWLITEKFAETKQGLPMEFATFEDTTALYDATLFPDVYRRCCHLLSTDYPFVLQGLVEEHYGVVTLTVHDLRILPAAHRAHRNNGLSQSLHPWYGDPWDDERRTDPPRSFCLPS
ncbi:MAG TPA: hypothetical protein VHF07_05290 [Nitrospiraceae bacterium]|nr:hypothetical protein [Nitrospiraceae bacterium]